MAAGAAQLVDHILPHVPVLQWVLSLPHALRYRLAWDHTGVGLIGGLVFHCRTYERVARCLKFSPS